MLKRLVRYLVGHGRLSASDLRTEVRQGGSWTQGTRSLSVAESEFLRKESKVDQFCWVPRA